MIKNKSKLENKGKVQEEKILSTYLMANSFIKKNYLSVLTELDIVPVPNEINDLKIRDSFRLLKIDKIVYDKNENNLDKLSNIYNALHNINSSLIMILDSNGKNIDLFIGIKIKNDSGDPTVAKNVLKKTFKGNFPGSNLNNLSNNKINEIIEVITKSKYEDKERTISSVSGIPSLKDDKDNFVQGLEKLIDAMQGDSFSAIFISDSIKNNQIENIKSGYENIYSKLSPFSQNNYSFSVNESKTVTEGLTEGFTETINQSLTQTQNYTVGKTETSGYSQNSSTNKNKGAGIGGVIGLAVGNIILPGAGIVPGAIVGGVVGGGIIGGESKGETFNNSESNNYSKSRGESKTFGKSHSKSSQKSRNEAETVGSSKTIQITEEKKSVSSLLAKIDDQLDRLSESQDYGMWNSACYFLADDPHTANIAASTYKSLMRGENSAIETAFVNTWDNDNKEKLVEVKKYLKKLSHPLIDFKNSNFMDTPYVTPGSLISGKELTIQMGLPLKSVKGISVMETAEFGRNILLNNNKLTQGENIEIGKFYHMGKIENKKVKLNLNSLTAHTFITGSTGTGKSNTIYKMIDELRNKNKNFLVIEPAKGEYKNVFGGYDDVNVFGTNSKYTELLRINPFKFPENIHILEHIDRLIEIFNACWPMYAAMPAVLKEAIEETYRKIGWDLDNSIFLGEHKIYPSIKDLVSILPDVIKFSSYSDEVKSNYIGALVTRVKSLTTGLTGQILTNNELSVDKLFTENCIIDLSRVSSMETKSLLMGIVFMRLQEDRFSNTKDSNNKLNHVTILEEAHHLLRKSSMSQNQESGNLQGKSVEMISNSIAEMRSYGEGFIIVDQSPDLLDSSVIKNTNTKIILKLPDKSDRDLVGKAANLNDEQIKEISKLNTGVAAVYQNNWSEPILAKIDEFTGEKSYDYIYNYNKIAEKNLKYKLELIKLLFNNDNLIRNNRVFKIVEWIKENNFNFKLRKILIKNLLNYSENYEMELWKKENYFILSKIINVLVSGDKIIFFAKNTKNYESWTEKALLALSKYIDIDQNNSLKYKILKAILRFKANNSKDFEKFYFAWKEAIFRKEVI